MFGRFRHAVAGVTASVFLATPALAQTEIQWWHAMGGELGKKVEEIAQGFNETQGDFTVLPVYKGNYTETMTGAIAAFRAKQHPHIVQVFEVGTATMMAAKGAVYPVYQLMKDQGLPFDPKNYLPSVTGYFAISTDPIPHHSQEVVEASGSEFGYDQFIKVSTAMAWTTFSRRCADSP